MTDPAAEAAHRVCPGYSGPTSAAIAHIAIAGARKAFYERLDEYSRGSGDYRAGVLLALAPLIYTADELQKGK